MDYNTLNVKKNDFIVVTYNTEKIEPEAAHGVFEQIQELYPENRVIVLPEDYHFKLASREELADTINLLVSLLAANDITEDENEE